MKKKYINPTTEIIEIKMQSLIATSSLGMDGSTPVDPGTADSRELDFFDE